MSVLDTNYKTLLEKINSFEEYQNELKKVTEEKIWQDVKRKNNEEGYQSYIDTFSNGIYINEAKEKLHIIKNLTLNISSLINWANENNLSENIFI